MFVRFTQLLVVLCCALITFPFVRAQEPVQPRLRVLTYNIHHCQGTDGKFDYARIAKIITNLNTQF